MNRLLFILTFVLGLSTANAQSDYLKFRTYKPYNWMIGAGWSFVDNDGRPYSKIFDVSNWSIMPYPSYITVDRYFKYGFSLELGLSFNQFKGQLVNKSYASGLMFGADLTARYSFHQFWYKKAGWFDPYLGVGLGATYITASTPNLYPSLNGVVGSNFWFGDWGLRLQGTAKFGVAGGFYATNANYLQYTASVIYKFHPKEKVNRPNDKRRHKWATKKPKKYKDSRSK